MTISKKKKIRYKLVKITSGGNFRSFNPSPYAPLSPVNKTYKIGVPTCSANGLMGLMCFKTLRQAHAFKHWCVNTEEDYAILRCEALGRGKTPKVIESFYCDFIKTVADYFRLRKTLDRKVPDGTLCYPTLIPLAIVKNYRKS